MSMLTAELDHSCRRLTQALDGGEQAHTQTHTCEGKIAKKHTFSLAPAGAAPDGVPHGCVGSEVPFVSTYFWQGSTFCIPFSA
jgi:hypothetical protein